MLPSTLLASLLPEHDVLLEKAPSLDHSEAQDSAFAIAPGAAVQLWLSAQVPLDPLLQDTMDSTWAERETGRGRLAWSTTTLICLFSR